ncbi:MAG: hypothetical protein IKW74_03820, partial [Thermoguttaceae bacterium]|nr:hypothetical protein [Thermoguttaceae bacterium]
TNSLAQEGEYKSFPSAKDLEVEESPVPVSHSSDNNSGNLLADYQRDLQSQPIPSEVTAPLSRSENIPTTSYQTRAVENVASLPQEYSTQTYLPADSNSAALSGNTPDFSMDYNNRNNSYNTGNNYSGSTNNISPSMDTPAFPTMPNIPVSNETYNTGNAIAPNRVSGPESTQTFQDYQGNNQYSLNSPSPSNIQPQADPRNPSNTPNLQYNGYQTNGQEAGSGLSANGTYGGGNTENITYPSYTTIPSPYLPSTENGTASGFTPGSIGNY